MKKNLKYSALFLTFLYFSNTAISATPNNSSVKKYQNVNSMVEDIVAISSLQQNFTIVPVPNYENALALVKNNKRIIAYDPIWLDKMSRETGNQCIFLHKPTTYSYSFPTTHSCSKSAT